MNKGLLDIWYQCLKGHHKDRDCYFSVERTFCTYKEMAWVAVHDGYLYDYREEFDTCEEAVAALEKFACSIIRDTANAEIIANANFYEGYNDAPNEHWRKVLADLENYETKLAESRGTPV